LEEHYPIKISAKKNSYTLNPKMLRAALNGYGIDMEEQCVYYKYKMENGWTSPSASSDFDYQ
jgi:hypothetical protein